MKSRYWTFIVYPESAKENWKEEMSSRGLVFAVSPLHDKDINQDGEIKKPHYHVMVTWDAPRSYNNALEVSNLASGVIPKRVESVRGMYRYFAHLDNPEKTQYNIEDIEKYGGFELDLTSTEVTRILKEITQDIKTLKIKEYCDLLDYYQDIGDNDKWELTSNHTFFLDKYICSKRNKEKNTLQLTKKVVKCN